MMHLGVAAGFGGIVGTAGRDQKRKTKPTMSWWAHFCFEMPVRNQIGPSCVPYNRPQSYAPRTGEQSSQTAGAWPAARGSLISHGQRVKCKGGRDQPGRQGRIVDHGLRFGLA